MGCTRISSSAHGSSRSATHGTPPGYLPAPGWDESYAWQGWVDFEDLPSVLNPEDGEPDADWPDLLAYFKDFYGDHGEWDKDVFYYRLRPHWMTVYAPDALLEDGGIADRDRDTGADEEHGPIGVEAGVGRGPAG